MLGFIGAPGQERQKPVLGQYPEKLDHWTLHPALFLLGRIWELFFCLFVCLFCFVLFLSAHSVLNWVVVANVYVDCHSKYSFMFLFAPRMLGFARFHQPSEKGKLEAGPLNSPQKTCGFGCLEQLFLSPG